MKYVYAFSEGNKDMRNTLGGKGANLAEMTSLGLPVPQGFTVSTDACIKYYEENETINDLDTAVGGDTEKEREIPENTGK